MNPTWARERRDNVASPAVDGSAPCVRVGCRPSRRRPSPICDVTKTRLPCTIGDDTPAPASAACHATLSRTLHVDGNGDGAATPVADGPRQCGQSVALSAAVAQITRTRARYLELPRFLGFLEFLTFLGFAPGFIVPGRSGGICGHSC